MRPDLSPVSLPFREDELSHESQGYSIADFSQKSVIFGRTFVQWAGSKIVASALVDQIRNISGDGVRRVERDATVANSGLLESELREVSLIYHYNTSPDTIFVWYWNCDVIRAGEVICSGSGVPYFFDELTVDPGELPSNELMIQELIGKSLGHSLIEWNGTESLDHLYGGWFEFCSKNEQSFQKLPYAIKLWSRSNGILGSGGPIFFGFYIDNTLTILRLDPTEIDGKVSHSLRLTVVQDFLRRDAQSFRPPKSTVTPTFIEHIVLTTDGPHFVYRQSQSSKEMILEVNERGIRVSYAPELRERLLSLEPKDRALKFFPSKFRRGGL
jgi:hypothetical protein